MKKNVTIMDIAKACGLSKSTVGYALNNEISGKVSKKNLDLVMATAKQLGYRPNKAAKTLSSNKSKTIGIMLPSPENRFFASLVIELQKRFFKLGYISFFVFWEKPDDAAKISEAYDALISQGVDGLITCELDKSLLKPDIPTVLFHDDTTNSFDSVSLDGYAGYLDAVSLMLSLGRKKIAYIGASSGSYRKKGYLAGLKQAGLPINPEWIKPGGSRDCAKAAMEQFMAMPEPPNAIIASNDDMALTAMGAAIRAGKKIPDDIAVIGCDNTEESRYHCPSLTSFNISIGEIASNLLELLFRRIEQPKAEIINRKLKMDLIRRESA